MKRVVWLLLLAPAMALAIYDYDSLAKNRWRLGVTNFGEFGHDIYRATAGGEWPNGSGHMYIYGAGFWLGAIIGDTYTMVGYNPNSGKAEWTPGDSAGGVADSAVKDYLYPENWPAPLARFPRAPQQNLSEGDVWRCYDDFDTTLCERHPGGPRRSLGIQVFQTDYVANGYVSQNAVYMRYEFENQSQDTYREVYAGVAMDPDIGGANNDYCRMIYHRLFSRPSGGFIHLDHLAAAYSQPEVGWDTNGTVAVVFIKMPDECGISAMKIATLQSGDPVGDKQQFLALAGYDWWRTPPVHNPIDSNDVTPADKRFIVGAGPFTLVPGQSESLVVLLLASPFRPDSSILELVESVWLAESLYLAGPPLGVGASGTPAPVMSGLSAWPNPFRDQVSIQLAARGERQADMAIYDAQGGAVRTVRLPHSAIGSPQSVVWDGKNAKQRPVPPGVYFVRAGRHTLKLTRGY